MSATLRAERVPAAERAAAPALSHADLDYRPSYKAAGVVALAVFGLYALTLAPSTAMWDASEYIAAAYVLGIPHPPGNPFFMLIGRVFAILPVAPSVAMRINVLAALCSAVAAGVWFLVAERVMVSWLARRWQRIVGGVAAALIGATAFTVWNQSVVNEKVYTVSLAFFAIVSWLVVRWCDEPDAPKADRLLVLAAYLIGLGYTNHPAGLLVGPAVAAGVLLRRPSRLLNWRLLTKGALAFALGLTPFLYQPIRAAHFPEINEGEPTACTTKIGFDCTFDKTTWTRLKANIDREQYGKPSLTERQAPFTGQVDMWWTYFRWQWIRDAYNEHRALQSALAVLFLALGLVGGYAHWKRDKQSFWFFGPLVFSVTLALIFYMNFKYGASQAPELGNDVPREVRDRDYFYLWSFSTWGVWAALGLVWVWETVAGLLGSERVKLGRETVDVPTDRSWKLASPVMALALVPLFTNWSQASRAGHRDTSAFAKDLLNSVEPYGILVTVGDNDTFPLWYAQEVEGVRKDVIIANTSLMNTDWYARQMIRRPVFEYDAAKGPEIYRGQQWAKPAGPPVNLTLTQVDSIPPVIGLDQPMQFQAGPLTTTITRPAAAQGRPARADMIRDAWPAAAYVLQPDVGRLRAGARPAEPQCSRRGWRASSRRSRWSPAATRCRCRARASWTCRARSPCGSSSRAAGADRAGRLGGPAERRDPRPYTITGIMLAESLARSGRAQESQQVLNTSEQVARAMRRASLFGFDQMRRAPADPLAPGADNPLKGLVPTDSPTDAGAAAPR
jgi:hypothetical protein